MCEKFTFKHLIIIKDTKLTFFGTQISRRAYFNGQSFIASTHKISFFDGFEGGFNFQTFQPNGLLFYYASGVSICFSLRKRLCDNCFVY